MSEDLKEFLTGQIGPDDRKLFRSGLELARSIASLDTPGLDNPYRGKEATVASFLNQTFRGVRRCSDELRQLIKESVLERLAAQPEDVRHRYAKELDDIVMNSWVMRETSIRLAKAQADDLGTWERMLRREAVAKDVFVVNPIQGPSYRVASHPMRVIMIRRLGLWSSQEDLPSETANPWDDGGFPAVRYTFCVPDLHRAESGWRNIFREVTGVTSANPVGMPISPGVAASRLAELNRLNLIRIYVVPEEMCGLPVVVYDAMNSDAEAFIPFFTSDNSVIAHAVEPSYLPNWRSTVYERVILAKIPSVIRVPWLDAEAPLLVADAESILGVTG